MKDNANDKEEKANVYVEMFSHLAFNHSFSVIIFLIAHRGLNKDR